MDYAFRSLSHKSALNTVLFHLMCFSHQDTFRVINSELGTHENSWA